MLCNLILSFKWTSFVTGHILKGVCRPICAEIKSSVKSLLACINVAETGLNETGKHLPSDLMVVMNTDKWTIPPLYAWMMGKVTTIVLLSQKNASNGQVFVTGHILKGVCRPICAEIKSSVKSLLACINVAETGLNETGKHLPSDLMVVMNTDKWTIPPLYAWMMGKVTTIVLLSQKRPICAEIKSSVKSLLACINVAETGLNETGKHLPSDLMVVMNTDKWTIPPLYAWMMGKVTTIVLLSQKNASNGQVFVTGHILKGVCRPICAEIKSSVKSLLACINVAETGLNETASNGQVFVTGHILKGVCRPICAEIKSSVKSLLACINVAETGLNETGKHLPSDLMVVMNTDKWTIPPLYAWMMGKIKHVLILAEGAVGHAIERGISVSKLVEKVYISPPCNEIITEHKKISTSNGQVFVTGHILKGVCRPICAEIKSSVKSLLACINVAETGLNETGKHLPSDLMVVMNTDKWTIPPLYAWMMGKTFASALELMFTAVLCWMIFGISIDMYTVVALGIVTAATFLYSHKPVVNLAKTDEHKTKEDV
ncbi:SLC35A1_2_3 [Mytilus edulis]|uniref:SLC35A1_2_3 n=1 Tax=Mytilus edulis TaxID=6550 RepID=A0A8S3U8F7_MYTED|nr:SLC35A1_2_3 [Mytilus edulis]